jgi:LysR family hydrogen peroxide-inducible transcriptional activator
VADLGSFSRAADACHVAQPSLSQQIIKLEAELGRPLFDRLGRTVKMTEAGRALLPRARRILSEVQAVENGIAGELDAAGGSLSIGAIPTIAPYLLPDAIRRVLAERPNADLLVREDVTPNLVRAVLDGELDMVIMSLPVEDDRLRYEKILTEPLLVAMPKGHRLLAAHGNGGNNGGGGVPPRVRPTDLDGEPVVILQELHCLGDQVRSLCRQRRVKPHVVCRGTQLATLTSLVGLGLGVSVVPLMCAASAAKTSSARCAYRRVADAAWQRTVIAAWHGNREQPRLARFIIQHLQEQWTPQAIAKMTDAACAR